MTKYKCSVCNITVIVKDSEIFRPCNHKDAPVVAEMSATTYGVSSLENK